MAGQRTVLSGCHHAKPCPPHPAGVDIRLHEEVLIQQRLGLRGWPASEWRGRAGAPSPRVSFAFMLTVPNRRYDVPLAALGHLGA